MQAERASGYEERDARQRQRLRAAAIGMAAAGGHGALTVSGVCERAGCSELTFRRHYDDLSACLKDVCSDALDQTRAAAIGGWLAQHGWRQRLLGACEELLGFVEANEDAARVVLVESMKAGPALTDHLRQRLSGFERALTMAFQLHPEGFPTSQHVPRAVSGGVRRLAVSHLLERNQGQSVALPALAEGISEWICSYRTPMVERLRKLGPTPLERIEAAQRALPLRRSAHGPNVPMASMYPGEGEPERILSAVAYTMLQRGREVLEDETVARFAKVDLERFVERYGGVEGCVPLMLEGFFKQIEVQVEMAFEDAESWPDGVCRASRGLVRVLCVQRRDAHLCLLRLPLVPSLAGAEEEELKLSAVEPMLAGAPEPKAAVGLLADALTGALQEILPWALLRGGPLKVKGLEREIAFLVLAPCLGPEQAVSAILRSAEAEAQRLGRER